MPVDLQYLDACVLLAYVLNEPGRAPTVQGLLSEAEGGERRLISSTISIVEVAFGSEKAHGSPVNPSALEAIDNLWVGGQPVALADPSIRIMTRARDLKRAAVSRNFKLEPMDAIHLATASQVGASVVFTYEKEATRAMWAELTGLDVEEPRVDQLPFE